MMPQLRIFKPDPTKLKNAIAAIVERSVRSIKRFAAALHNRCNLIVYVDELGRTCSTFLKKDAFTGYHFDFKGDRCTVTNKESGDVYVVSYSLGCKWCPCESYKYSPKQDKNCKHLQMIGELRGDLEQAIAQAELDSYIEQQAIAKCTHPRIITGLDAMYCPDCKKSIEQGTAAYERLLQKTIGIDPHNIPTGCRLKRTDYWMCVEFDLWAWEFRNERGIKTAIQKHLGRLVQHSDGIYTYRVTSGIARVFETTNDAIAYLVNIVGTSFEEIASAYEVGEEIMRKRIAWL